MSEKSLNNNRALAEGALLISLTVILYLINLGVGLLSWAIPIPLAIFCFRNETKWAILSCLAASLLTGMLLGPTQGTTLLLSSSLVSIVCGVTLKKDFSDLKAILLTAVAFMVSLFLSVGMTAVITNVSPLSFRDEIITVFEETGEMMEDQYRAYGIDETTLANFSSSLERTMEFIKNAFWSILLLACIAISLLIVNLTRLVLLRLKSNVKKATPFSNWTIPWKFIWVLISGILVYVVGNWLGNSILSIVGINIMFFAFAIYVIGGVSLLVYIFKERKFPTFILVISLIFVFMLGLYYFLAIVCIADGWLNLRKRISEPTN